jgi:hypothetical protein
LWCIGHWWQSSTLFCFVPYVPDLAILVIPCWNILARFMALFYCNIMAKLLFIFYWNILAYYHLSLQLYLPIERNLLIVSTCTVRYLSMWTGHIKRLSKSSYRNVPIVQHTIAPGSL